VTAERTDIPPPPEGLVEIVGGGLELGERHVAELRDRAGLRPGDRVLDVGCGVGRTAIPLTSYLSPEGAYEGFDIWPEAVGWCSREIAPRFPQFRFTQVDLFNGAYNPNGMVSPSTFTFPYGDGEFDVAFLYSVFTHMLARDFQHYLAELARVLKKGGRVLATLFLINDASLAALAAPLTASTRDEARVARFLLERDFGPFRAGYEVPEWLIAYDETFVRQAFDAAGFGLEEPISYGGWVEWARGEAPDMTGQDTILARR